jgi:hypothetical protein
MGYHSIELRSDAPCPSTQAPSRSLEVVVLFTDIPSTLGALRFAAQLAQGLTERIRLLLIQSVPYPLPLDRPQRSMSFVEWQFRTLIEGCPVESASRSVATTAEVVLCRDEWQGLRSRLGRDSVIVIGTRGRWWPRVEDRLARRLRASGHHVVRTSAPQQSAFRGSFHD